MRWPLAFGLAVACLAGCQFQQPQLDPFLGRTTVPPPGTGGAVSSAPPADPYYTVPGKPSTLRSQPNARLTPSAAKSSHWTENTSDKDRASHTTIDRSDDSDGQVQKQPDVIRAAAIEPIAEPDENRVVPSSRASVIRIVEPQSGRNDDSPNDSGPAPATRASTGSPAAGGSWSRVTDIGDLPPAGSLTQRTGESSTFRTNRTANLAATAAGSSPAATRPAKVVTLSGPQNRYGYDPAYRRLMGRLEFSQIDRLWKLRYIAPDGATDDYGGSVLIDDAAQIAGFRPGDFVIVEGTLQAQDASSAGFAPVYHVERIERQSQR